MRTFVGAAQRTGKLTAFEPKVELAGHILRYCPDGIYNDGNGMPLFVVYGDEGFTEQTALLALDKAGFADLAADANCNILFMSPVEGQWGAADVELYHQLHATCSHSFGGENGLQPARNFRTRQLEGYRLLGSEYMIYILATGKGAAFVAEHLLGDAMFRANQYGEGANHAAGVMLCNTDAQPTLGRLGMPAYLVNGTAAQAEAFRASLQSEVEDVRLVVEATSPVQQGFDPAQLMAAWQQVFCKVRRKDDGAGAELYPIPDYAGFVLKDESVELSTGKIRYLTYIPEAFDMSGTATYPLVMGFHGGGDAAIFHGWCSAWPLIGKENGFVTIEVDQHVHRPASDMVELLEHILQEYPAIDPGKVYVSGFSMGSMKSWDCGFGYTTYFAGIAPMDATGRGVEPDMVTFDGVTVDYEHKIPTFYVAGELDALPVGPNQAQPDGTVYTGCNSVMNAIYRKNGTGTYTFDPAGDPYWGLTGRVESLTEGRLTAHAHYVANPDGVEYAAFCNVQNQTHAQMPVSCRLAWQFLRQFRRLPNGEIVVEK